MPLPRCQLPADPGHARETLNYAFAPGIGALCLVHGYRPGSGPARRQLVDAGVRNERLLTLALDSEPPHGWQEEERGPGLALVLLAYVLVELMAGALRVTAGDNTSACVVFFIWLAAGFAAAVPSFGGISPISTVGSAFWIASLIAMLRPALFALTRTLFDAICAIASSLAGPRVELKNAS